MNMLYLLYKTQFQEEEYGLLTSAPSILKGVFTDEPSAVLAKLDLEKECTEFKAQFGSSKEEIILLKVEPNKIIDIYLHKN